MSMNQHTTSPQWITHLHRLDACEHALNWAYDYSTLKEAWQACQRGDWMVWYLGHTLENTRHHQKCLVCVGIRTVLDYTMRTPIAEWDEWAQAYLTNIDQTLGSAVHATRAARIARTSKITGAASAVWASSAVWGAQVGGISEAAWLVGAVWNSGELRSMNIEQAGHMVREYFPLPPADTSTPS